MNKNKIFIDFQKLQRLYDHEGDINPSKSGCPSRKVVTEFLQTHSLFSFIYKYMGMQGIEILLKISTVEEYYKKEIVQRKLLEDKFAVILTGKVGVFYPIQNKKEMYLLLNYKLKGDTLTSWELKKDYDPNVFFRCQTPSFILFVDKGKFSLLRKNVEIKKMDKIVSFLQLNKLFKGIKLNLTPFLERSYAELELKQLDRGDYVYKEGDPSEGIFFVYRGNLTVLS